MQISVAEVASAGQGRDGKGCLGVRQGWGGATELGDDATGLGEIRQGLERGNWPWGDAARLEEARMALGLSLIHI